MPEESLSNSREPLDVPRDAISSKQMIVNVPGRVNLIGEHIDYHGLAVLPMAIQRRIRVAFEPRADSVISAESAGYPAASFEWTRDLKPGAPGEWLNYVKAGANAVAQRWGVLSGIDARIESDLPPAAGLSSSSALLTAVTIALLKANGIEPQFEELMEILPEAEYFVGTRGGGMDHAAVLGAEAGRALLVRFEPAVTVEPVRIPGSWSFLVAHSMHEAEKSGALRAEYNQRRSAGDRAIQKASDGFGLHGKELEAYLHVKGEARRVNEAVEAMRAADMATFGRLINESHASLRDWLRVSTPDLDELCEAARRAGAVGARVTGAGFGGCALVFCRARQRDAIAAKLVDRFYAKRPGFDPSRHLIPVEPSAGALQLLSATTAESSR